MNYNAKIFLLKKAWKYLSMTNVKNIEYNGFVYKNMYKLMYAVAFPSRRDEINNMNTFKLKELRLGLEYFEISVRDVVLVLLQVLREKCLNDKTFLSKLKRTRRKVIINNDYIDPFFGHPKNIYGRCLMKVREEFIKRKK